MAPDRDAPRRREDDQLEVAFSLKELFQRIERQLELLTTRVDVEIGKLSTNLATMERLGSSQAQEALRNVRAQEIRIVELEKTTVSREAVDRYGTQLRSLQLGVILSVVGWIVTLIITFARK